MNEAKPNHFTDVGKMVMLPWLMPTLIPDPTKYESTRRVKRIEYHENGAVMSVEYFPMDGSSN